MGEWEGLLGILGLAFGLGLVHALDADHVLAVSTLASRNGAKARPPWHFCLHWALGHGTSLLLIGISVIALSSAIPYHLSHYAEAGIGLLLVGMGLWVIYSLHRQALRLGFHHHKGLPRHAHWHTSDKNNETAGQHDHSATLVGALHGMAGSAPLLALIPLTTQQSLAWGIAYLLLFSLGVLASMLVFGGLLGVFFQRVASWGTAALNGMRTLIAGGSIAIGLYILTGVT